MGLRNGYKALYRRVGRGYGCRCETTSSGWMVPAQIFNLVLVDVACFCSAGGRRVFSQCCM